MELLIVLSVAAWWVLAGPVQDIAATRSGRESPRRAERERMRQREHELRMIREQRRQGPTIAEALAHRIRTRVAAPRERPRGPARQYLADLWGDAWGHADERRRTYGARRDSGELPRQRARRAAGEWTGRIADAVGEQARSDAQRVRERSRARRAERDATEPPQGGQAADPWVADPFIDPDPTGPVIPPRAAPPPPPPPPPSDPDTVDLPSPVIRQASERTDRVPYAPDPPIARPAIEATRPSPEPTEPPAPLASVTPIRGDMTMDEQTGGETLDPQQGLTFAEGMRRTGEEIVARTETSIAALTAAGVSGGPIEHLAGIQEAGAQLVANAQGAESYFQSHLNIQDVAHSDRTVGGERYLGVGDAAR